MEEQEKAEKMIDVIEGLKQNEFMFEGVKFKIDYGLQVCIKDIYNNDFAYSSFDYGEYIALFYPEKKWFNERGGSYQGEWVSVGYDYTGYYFQKGSFGSCSGCDMLEGINTKESAIQFLKEMKKIIKIGNNKDEAIAYLENEKKNGWSDLNEAIDKIIKEIE